MKLFVPHVEEGKTLHEWQQLKHRAEEYYGRDFSPLELYQMSYSHNGTRLESIVGKEEPDYKGSQVLAIFESEDKTIFTSVFRQRNGSINFAMVSASGTSVTEFDSEIV